MICIDGTFLTGRYKGQILTAIGVDCNNQIVPLAFAFVENENLDSWYWFLERVKVHVVAARLAFAFQMCALLVIGMQVCCNQY